MMSNKTKSPKSKYRAYVYYYYMNNVKQPLAIAFIVLISGCLLLVAYQIINNKPILTKSYNWEGKELNGSMFKAYELNYSMFIKYWCFNNITYKFDMLHNKLEIVPNVSAKEVCDGT